MNKRPPVLTKRERDVVPFLVSGAAYQDIADHFQISSETVKVHVRSVFRKFGGRTLKDVFQDLSEYQKYYGLGGLEFSRFILDYKCRYEVAANYQDVKISETFSYLIVAEQFSGITSRITIEKTQIGAHSYKTSHPAKVEFEKAGINTIQRIHLEPPLQAGDIFKFEENLSVTDCFANDSCQEVLIFNGPGVDRIVEFYFVGAPPKAFQANASLGFDPIENVVHSLERTERFFKFKVQPKVSGLRFTATWDKP